MEKSQLVLIYATFPDSEVAKSVAKILIEEKFVTCVNIFNNATSIYTWEDMIQENSEVIVITKTLETKSNKIVKRIEKLHPYECPSIIVLPVLSGSKNYISWTLSHID